MTVYAVGVGPGAPEYLTKAVSDVVSMCDVVIGYQYTLNTIKHLFLDDKKIVCTVTMADQEAAYQRAASMYADKNIVIPFTGDVNFSESEVVDRLTEIFGSITIIPGISSIQAAAAKAGVPLDKSRVITLHVTVSIQDKKLELLKGIIDGFSVIVLPRPWPSMPDKHFMPSEISTYLSANGIDTTKLKVCVFESLTTDKETVFAGTADKLVGREFSPLSVMVFNQTKPDSYINYRWQWESTDDCKNLHGS